MDARYRWSVCKSCGEKVELLWNPLAPNVLTCSVRTRSGRCGGLIVFTDDRPTKETKEQAVMATPDEMEAFEREMFDFESKERS